MLRPERMSRVSITGTKAVMRDVVEAVHDLGVVHLVDYDDAWEGFTPGDPIEGASLASERLVTVRSIESILDVTAADASGTVSLSDAQLEREIEDLRGRVNDLDDRRGELRDELRSVEDRLETARPLVDLGIDLDLLGGYDHLAVRVGEGDEAAVAAAVADQDVAFDTFTGDDAVAVFAATDGETLDEALVGVEFTQLPVPDAEGPPAEYAAALERDRDRLVSELSGVEEDLESLKAEAASFVLAAEERLTIEVQKTEAPLRFATTANAFVAEGWVPADRVDDLERAVEAAVGDHAEVEELGEAAYAPPHGHGDGDEAAVADGGSEMAGGEPPVIQDNPGLVRPFELLVETINRPQYWDFDPSIALFLTFPLFFGFMIGDLGYGILYMAIGYWLWTGFDSDAIRSLGGIALWAGGFTAVFGVLYGEIFGLHLITEYLWVGALGMHHPPIEKGLSPATAEYATAWLVVVMVAGLAHVTLGYVFDFVQTLSHGVKEAVLESGSWVLLMLGAWAWIFSRSAAGAKPAFLFEAFDGHPFPLGFAGFGADVGLAALGVAALGFVLLLAAEGGIGLLESLNVLVNILSYARIAAVLLAKAGMAFTVNLLFFGVYAEGEPAAYHFMISHGPAYVLEHSPEASILFPGLIHTNVLGVLAGLVIIVLGHLIVLALGVTSAGLQAVRLEYVEFFSKFYYEGGAGKAYEPFGHDRTFTAPE